MGQEGKERAAGGGAVQLCDTATEKPSFLQLFSVRKGTREREERREREREKEREPPHQTLKTGQKEGERERKKEKQKPRKSVCERQKEGID